MVEMSVNEMSCHSKDISLTCFLDMSSRHVTRRHVILTCYLLRLGGALLERRERALHLEQLDRYIDLNRIFDRQIER